MGELKSPVKSFEVSKARINSYVMRWARRKFKRLGAKKVFFEWWQALVGRYPAGFVHWKWVPSIPAGW